MDNNILKTINENNVLNNLPKVESFLGVLDVRTGSFIISALSLMHHMVYGCTYFMPISYLLVTIWVLLAMSFAASFGLFAGLFMYDVPLINLWVWFTLVFIVIMLILLFLLALHFIGSNQKTKVLPVILGILWYILTFYFILVVNSHRNDLGKTGADPTEQAADPAPPVYDPAPQVDDTGSLVPPGNNPLGGLKRLRKASAQSYSTPFIYLLALFNPLHVVLI